MIKTPNAMLDRRQLLKGAVGLVAAVNLPVQPALAATRPNIVITVSAESTE